jgi:flagellar protein FliS
MPALYRNPIGKSYLLVATQTASPGHLVLMLYDGAIRFLEKAMHGFSSEDPAEFNQTINNNVQRAQAILDELNAALNLEQGGELAGQLGRIYHYLDRRLQESNLRKQPDGIEEVRERLVVLRDAWREMLSQPSRDIFQTPTHFAALG